MPKACLQCNMHSCSRLGVRPEHACGVPVPPSPTPTTHTQSANHNQSGRFSNSVTGEQNGTLVSVTRRDCAACGWSIHLRFHCCVATPAPSAIPTIAPRTPAPTSLYQPGQALVSFKVVSTGCSGPEINPHDKTINWSNKPMR